MSTLAQAHATAAPGRAAGAPGLATAPEGYALTIRDPEAGAMTVRVERWSDGPTLAVELAGPVGLRHARPALDLAPGDWDRLTAGAAGCGFWYAAAGEATQAGDAGWTVEGWRPGARRAVTRRAPEGDAVAYLGALLRGLARDALARQAAAAPPPAEQPRPWRLSSSGCA